MDELNKENLVEEDDFTTVVFTDDEGNEYTYLEELAFEAEGNTYAILVPMSCDEHEHGEGCECCDDNDEDVILAKIVTDEKGEVEYVEPTDEEFEAAQKAYNELMDQMESEEQ